MAELTVAMTYGNALFQAALDLGMIDTFWDELGDMKKLFDVTPELREFLSTPSVSVKDKKEELNNMFKGQVSDQFLNFLCVLVDKGRIGQYDRIVREYRRLVNDYNKLAYGTIYSVVPIPEDRLAKFEEETAALLGESVKLKNVIDTKIIGGVKIQINGKLIDASLRSRLDSLKDAII